MKEDQEMKIYIKNMVCDRCIMVIKDVLTDLEIPYSSIKLGEVVQTAPIDDKKKKELSSTLKSLGFELIDDKKILLTEQIKNLMIEIIYNRNNEMKVNLSTYLSDKLHQDYHYLSTLFSDMENTTIEKYFISQKIERVKELLSYGEHTLNEIAYMLNYSSVAYLSSQFKKFTGLTPSQYKNSGVYERKPLDKV